MKLFVGNTLRNHEMVERVLLLGVTNDRFNKDGEEENPVNCPCRYSFSSPGVRHQAQ